MFISLSSTCIQNFSSWYALFIFFITFCSRCGMERDTACRPTDDPFWAFYHLVHRSQFNPQTIFFQFGQLKKYILDIHPEKIIMPAPFHRKAFVLLYKLETSWALLGRLSKGCFAISGVSNFKQSLFITLSGLGLLTIWKLPRRVSYFVSCLLYNYFSSIIQDVWSSPSFLAFKTFISSWSVYHPTLAFSSFLSVSTTDKPVNRSIHAYAFT